MAAIVVSSLILLHYEWKNVTVELSPKIKLLDFQNRFYLPSAAYSPFQRTDTNPKYEERNCVCPSTRYINSIFPAIFSKAAAPPRVIIKYKLTDRKTYKQKYFD